MSDIKLVSEGYAESIFVTGPKFDKAAPVSNQWCCYMPFSDITTYFANLKKSEKFMMCIA